MTRRNRRRWDFWSWLTIGSPSNPMILRLRLIQTPQFGVYLHRILREDLDRDCHVHPWNFATLVLSGGYTERYYPNPAGNLDDCHLQGWRRFSFHRFPTTAAHYITAVQPRTLTLVFVGRPTGTEWGFYVRQPQSSRGHYIPWDLYDTRPLRHRRLAA